MDGLIRVYSRPFAALEKNTDPRTNREWTLMDTNQKRGRFLSIRVGSRFFS
jgi:hypothetical protein